MSDEISPGLTLIARQLRQLLNIVRRLKDDVIVLTAIAMHQDGTLSALLTEVRATHSQHSRLANRVRELEVARPGTLTS